MWRASNVTSGETSSSTIIIIRVVDVLVVYMVLVEHQQRGVALVAKRSEGISGAAD